MTSEMSGNVIDLCPVGALTSKPFAFAARNWELTVITCALLLACLRTPTFFSRHQMALPSPCPLQMLCEQCWQVEVGQTGA